MHMDINIPDQTLWEKICIFNLETLERSEDMENIIFSDFFFPNHVSVQKFRSDYVEAN